MLLFHSPDDKLKLVIHSMDKTLGLFIMNKNRSHAAQIASTHRENLQKNLQRRMEAARARGDEALLRMLEAEANYIR